MKTSYSQSNTYKDCSQHWHYRYVDKIQTEDSGASTFFGSAVDGAIIDMLEHPEKNCYKTFESLWTAGRDFKGKPTQIFDNNKINFAHADYDKDVIDAFKDEDGPVLHKWIEELKLTHLGTDYDVVYAAVAKAKKNPYKRLPDSYLTYFNRASWLSMYRKGLLLIESFEKQFLPKIEKVLAVQKHSSIKDETVGDSITGYIDMVLKLHGHERPIIFDLKTAARPYSQDQIEHSEQLTIYLAMEGQRFNTDMVGYIVLSKAINKDIEAYCKKCNYKKDGRHRSCNNMVNDIEPDKKPVRCDGEWNETVVLKPEVQVMIARKTDAQVNHVMEDQSNIIVGMKNGVVYKNTSKCMNWYGNKCPYYDLCHKGSDAGLIKKD